MRTDVARVKHSPPIGLDQQRIGVKCRVIVEERCNREWADH